MMRKYLVALFSAVFLGASCNAEPLTVACPESIVITEQQRASHDGWDDGSFEYVAALETLQVHWKKPVSNINGTFKKVSPEFSLMPDVLEESGLGWEAVEGGLWFECRYDGARSVLWRHVEGISKCVRRRRNNVDPIVCFTE